MATAFDRDQLLAAFDEIGEAAISMRRHRGARRILSEQRG
jgi:hypothetical protein